MEPSIDRFLYSRVSIKNNWPILTLKVIPATDEYFQTQKFDG